MHAPLPTPSVRKAVDAHIVSRIVTRPYTTLTLTFALVVISTLLSPPESILYAPFTAGTSLLALLLLANQCYLKKQQQQALQDSQWFQLVLSHINDTVITVNAHGEILFVNSESLSLLGYTPDELYGRTLCTVIPSPLQNDHQIWFQTITTSGSDNRSQIVETQICHKEGHTTHVELSLQETHYQGQRVFIGILKNISNRKARQAAEAGRQKLALAVHNSPSGVMITDKDGAIEYANPKLLAMTGFDHDEVIGQTPRIFSSGEKSQGDYKKMWDTLLAGNSWYDEFRNARKDGSHYWVVASIAPMFDEHNQITHFVSVQEDITSIKQANQAMADAKDLAEQALQARSEFLSGMNHELRTPLNAIIGFAQLLETDTLNQEQIEYTEQIISSGRHLLSLINEVLELAKVESGHYQLTPVNTNALSVIKESVAMVQHLSEQHAIHLLVATPENRLPMAYVDPGKLKQILLNLLSNAIKYNRPDGEVHVSIRASTPDTLRIEVSDTGIGIPESMHPQVFQSFNRLHAENSEIEGSGIGLALSKNLAELMEGRLGFESQEGQGSTFWIEIPSTWG